MSVNSILDLKEVLRSFQRSALDPVPSPSGSSGKVHLEVWTIRNRSKPIGFEMDHDTQVNLWLRRMDVPKDLPETVVSVHKEPKGRLWTDADGKGANSNLSGYDQFRGSKITRLEIKSKEDAVIVLSEITK